MNRFAHHTPLKGAFDNGCGDCSYLNVNCPANGVPVAGTQYIQGICMPGSDLNPGVCEPFPILCGCGGDGHTACYGNDICEAGDPDGNGGFTDPYCCSNPDTSTPLCSSTQMTTQSQYTVGYGQTCNLPYCRWPGMCKGYAFTQCARCDQITADNINTFSSRELLACVCSGANNPNCVTINGVRYLTKKLTCEYGTGGGTTSRSPGGTCAYDIGAGTDIGMGAGMAIGAGAGAGGGNDIGGNPAGGAGDGTNGGAGAGAGPGGTGGNSSGGNSSPCGSGGGPSSGASSASACRTTCTCNNGIIFGSPVCAVGSNGQCTAGTPPWQVDCSDGTILSGGAGSAGGSGGAPCGSGGSSGGNSTGSNTSRPGSSAGGSSGPSSNPSSRSSGSSSSRSSNNGSSNSSTGGGGGSAGSNGSNTSTVSNGSNGSNNSNTSNRSGSNSSESNPCPVGYTCTSKQYCVDHNYTNNGQGNVCGDSTTCCKIPSSFGSNGSASSGNSSQSVLCTLFPWLCPSSSAASSFTSSRASSGGSSNRSLIASSSNSSTGICSLFPWLCSSSAPSNSSRSSSSNGSLSASSINSSRGICNLFPWLCPTSSASSQHSNDSSLSNASAGSSTSNASNSSASSVIFTGVCCNAAGCNPFAKTCTDGMGFNAYQQCVDSCNKSSTSSNASSKSQSSNVSNSSLSKSSAASSSKISASSISSRSLSSASSLYAAVFSSASTSIQSGYCCINNNCRFGLYCSTDVNTCLATCGQSASSYSYGFSTGSIGYCCGVNGTCQAGAGCTADFVRCAQTCATTVVTAPPVAPHVPTSVSSVDRTVCNADTDCPASARCVLHQCFTETTIASLPAFCGNARLDVGEQCDNGALNSNLPNALCRPDCTFGKCGDGIIDTPQEQCDDGNVIPGDGCSSTCLPERAAAVVTSTLPAQVIELPFTASIVTQPVKETSTTISDYRQSTPPVPSTPATGPASLVIMLAGGAAGWLYRKRR